MISRRNKQRVKRANQALLLSVKNSHSSNPKKVVEVKDKWVKGRVAMDSGAAGHMVLETMFPSPRAQNVSEEVCGRKWRANQRLG